MQFRNCEAAQYTHRTRNVEYFSQENIICFPVKIFCLNEKAYQHCETKWRTETNVETQKEVETEIKPV
jgi:hypothetical protein